VTHSGRAVIRALIAFDLVPAKDLRQRTGQMNAIDEFPEDFRKCVRFHGHLCPGLAIGYAAANAGARALGVGASEDEEVVAIVENDSCAVDAVQALLGCTFGKGNLIFRDWGKQVFTFLDRKSGRAVRVSFRGPMPGNEERAHLKRRIDSGEATDADRKKWEDLRKNAALDLVTADPTEFFDVEEVRTQMPPQAVVVGTRPCEKCGEPTVESRLQEREGRLICRGCAADIDA